MKLSYLTLLLLFFINGCSVNVYHHRAHSDKSCCQKKCSKAEAKKKCTSKYCAIEKNAKSV